MNKTLFLSIAGALVLTLATPVMAQGASLAERVAALEQQAANNRGNVDLVNQVTALKGEVQALRSQLEELQHQQEQAGASSRTQYLDLDGRLNRLEGGGATGTGLAPSAATADLPASPDAGIGDSPPTIYGDAGLQSQGEDERAAYDAAFAAIKAGQYDQSAQLFQDFLQRYPNGSWAPNALYWLGESYYVTQNYALAQQQFQTLLDRYPTHDKAPGALLKVGLSQYGARQFDAAEATLAQVIERYPGTDAARTAADRLNAIDLSQVR